jgi:hypothetical protein
MTDDDPRGSRNPARAEHHHHREQDTTTKMNDGAPVNLLDRPELPELSVNGAELSVNGSSPHIDDQPPEPPADPDDGMKHYCVEMTFETGDWTDGHAGGRCEDAELWGGKIYLCFNVHAHTEEEALTTAVTAARTAIHNAATATRRFEPTQLKLLDRDKPQRQLLQDRKPPVPWTLLPPAEIERLRSDARYRRETGWPRWSSSDVNGAECWAVTVCPHHPNDLPRDSLFGCWVPE